METLLANATDDELRVIAAVKERADAAPAIVVTMRLDNRRYVVDQNEEGEFRGLVGLNEDELRARVQHDHGYFGALWLRAMGRVDECHRSLGMYDVKRVQAVDRKRVWGHG